MDLCGIVIAILVVLIIWIIVKAIQNPVQTIPSRRYNIHVNMSLNPACIESRISNYVSQPFKSGVIALGKIVEILDLIGTNPSQRVIKDIAPFLQNQAKIAYRSMKKASQEVSQINKELNERVEKTVNELGLIRGNLSTQKAELNYLNSQRDSLRQEKRQIDDELTNARRSIDDAKRSVSNAERKLEEKKKEQAIVAAVGVGVSIIPIVGWIVGPTMVVISFTALEDNVKLARSSVGQAENNVSNARSRLSSKQNELSNLEKKINKVNRDHGTLENQLSQLQSELDALRQELQRQSSLSENVKQCFTFISVSFGHTRVVKDTAQHLYSLEPLIEPLKSFAHHFSAPEILNQPLLRKAVNFGEVERKLKMVCTTASITLIDDDVSEWA